MPDKEKRSEKKRKRQSEAGEPNGTPSKTRILDSASSSSAITVQHITADKDRGPVIVASAGLALPSNTKFKAYTKTPSEGSKAAPELLLHSSDHPKIDYTARQHQDVGADSLRKHYIGVYDPATEKLQVMEARKLSVRSTLRTEEQEAREEHVKEVANTLRGQRHDLGLTFGTKKAKKAINALSDNAIAPLTERGELSQEEVRKAIQADPAQAAILESMAAAVSAAPTQADAQAMSDAGKPRPKANDKADHPQDVYPISSIVGEETMKETKVRAWMEKFEAGDGIDTTSRFVSHRIENICQNDDIPRLKVLRYMYVLIRFYQALLPAGKSSKKLPPRDKMIKEMGEEAFLLDTVKRRFTDGGHMTKWHVDNVITHLCALSLIVDDFSTDTYDLREDLGLKSQEVRTYYHEVGVKLSKLPESVRTNKKMSKAEADQHLVAKLTLPLDFPKPKLGKRR